MVEKGLEGANLVVNEKTWLTHSTGISKDSPRIESAAIPLNSMRKMSIYNFRWCCTLNFNFASGCDAKNIAKYIK